MTLPPAFQASDALKPLPFDPAKLTGLSERLVKSHWENNDGGPVKAQDFGAAAAKYVDAFFQNLNWERVDARLAAVGAAPA